MTRNAFACKSYTKKGIPVVEIIGDITFETIDALRAEFSELRMQAPKRSILDCTGVTLLSSVGLGEFTKLIKWSQEQGSEVRIVCFSTHVVEVLEIAGITEMIPIFPSLELALKS